MHKGLLKSWKTDKGFGFIKSDTLEHDTFIHISALKHMSRKPKVGDTIYFEVATQPDGKTKAVNCRIEGVAELKAPYQKHKQQPHRIAKSNFASSFLGKVASISIIAVLGFIAVNKYNHYQSNEQFNSQTPVITNADLATFDEQYPKIVIPKSTQNFTCDGRQYCTEMNSRAEAVFFINNCPNTKMDGDGDGDPCERDTRF
ncbi:cold-shock protein [Pseudoalteromonas distincta]|uniref:Cold shock domain-containing protein n=1 Tax=Pseudoalteromonas distincta TaxID=77608 RepID=A0ABT9GGT0_9GAMM|nr:MULTISPECIES: cold shock domain-containing protein [Pseudoalteromonas distincta group]KHM45257.1 cold-shock protein [Pseudoalteromonas elyakovii]KID39108.1 cold-shock protein [Pseudoalteromonas distincta]MDP4484963.1 cold shock domain-containing protein [Pseudoalteromonas elyakovii]